MCLFDYFSHLLHDVQCLFNKETLASKWLQHFCMVMGLSSRQTVTSHTTSLWQVSVGRKYMDGIILVCHLMVYF